MTKDYRRPWLLARLLVLIAMLAVMGMNAGQGLAAGPLYGSFRGESYGTFANATAGQLATTLGRSAYIGTGCAGTGGVTRTNSIDDIQSNDSGKSFRAEKLYTTVFTIKTETTALNRDTAKVSGLNTLNGAVRATSVFAVARTSATTTTASSTFTESRFENLVVAGRAISTSVPPNTRVDIPGFGHAILKQTIASGDGKNSSELTVNMIVINITVANSLKIPVGSQIIVAHAKSGFIRTQPPYVVNGQAYATYARSTSTLVENRLGRSAAIGMGCQGTGGNTRTNNINANSYTNVLTTGTGTTTAYGLVQSTGTRALMTANVQKVNLLGGSITADGVKAVSESRYASGRGTNSTAGSQFLNLRVLGVFTPTTAVQPNTRVELPGIGYAILYEVKQSASTSGSRTLVNMIHMYVTNGANNLGLPAGTEVIVASADSSTNRF